MEIHRVEFRDAEKVTFKSIDEKEAGAPEIFEIDHANCNGGTLCDIDSCNQSKCTTLTQLLDAKKSKPSSNLCFSSGLCLDVRADSEATEESKNGTDSEVLESGSLGLIDHRYFNLLSISSMMFTSKFLFLW